MKYRNQIMAVSLLGLAIISSSAYSGPSSSTTGSTGGSGDYLKKTCQACNQIPPPFLPCASLFVETNYCGSEYWHHGGTDDCKRFVTVTFHCALGGTQVFTTESWSGAGSWCDGGQNPDCEF